MNPFGRRSLLRTTAWVIPALVVTACGAPTSLTPTQIVTGAQNAVGALFSTFNSVVQQFPAVIPSDVQAVISSSLDAATKLLANLSPSITVTAGASVVQQIDALLNAVVAAAAKVPGLPAPFSIALAAAGVVLPSLEAFVNQYLPGSTPAVSAPSPAALAEARYVLAQFASGKTL